MSFASRLRERREALGLTQAELGKLLNITGSAIGNYENGISSPKADILYRVFDVLQCDANYLFQDEMMESPESPQSIREQHVLDRFRQFNEEGQEKVITYVDDLAASGRYKKNNTPEMDQAQA